METTIKIDDLLNLTLGQLIARTEDFRKQFPNFKTAQELLDERE